MPSRPDRKFTLLDLLILIAATAAGLGAMRALSPDHDNFTAPYSPISPPTWMNWGSVVALNWAFYLSPLLAAWTLGILALRLRRPRPSLRRLAFQPGWVACCVATVGIAAGTVMTLIGVYGRYGIGYYFDLVPYPVGVAVAAAWTQLAVSGRWRSEGSWIDRAGRVMGIAWLAIVPLLWGRFLSLF